MYKVIVVEDEVRVCNLIVKLIDWDGLGLELSGVAYDGISASELIEKLNPEVVITDIRLPGITGIDLIQKNFEENREKRPKFIIISGYKEFEYAQSALKYGAEDFLLKPVNRNELNNSLRKTIGKMEESDKRSQRLFEIDEKMDYYRNLHRMLMLKTITETPDGLQSLTPEEFNRQYGVAFAKPYVCSFIIRIFVTGGNADSIPFFEEKLSESVLCDAFTDYAATKFLNGIICYVNLEKEQLPEFRSRISLMKDRIDKCIFPYDFVSFVIGVGEEAKIAENGFVRAARTAEYAANAVIALSDNPIFYRDIPREVSLLFLLKNEDLEKLLSNAVERLDRAQLKKYLSSFEALVKNVPNYRFGLYEAVEKAVDRTMSLLQKQYDSVCPIQKAREQAGRDLLNCRTEPQLLSLMEKSVLEAADEISKTIRQLENPTITTVKRYVGEHYADRITLETAAETVYLNPSYLAALFKKETGITFLDYLTGVRINRAKVLLGDVKLNISQITRAIGYNDSKHFTKLFLKYTGVKPQEYRKLYINNLL